MADIMEFTIAIAGLGLFVNEYFKNPEFFWAVLIGVLLVFPPFVLLLEYDMRKV